MQQTITLTARERATVDAVLDGIDNAAVRTAVYGAWKRAVTAADGKRPGAAGMDLGEGAAVRLGLHTEVTLPDDVWTSVVAAVREQATSRTSVFDLRVLNAIDDQLTDTRINLEATALVRLLRKQLFAPTTVVSEKLQLIDKARLVLGDHGASEASYALQITQTAHDLEAAMRDVEQAAEGDSNDAEIEAWQTVGQHAALLTGLLLAGPAEDAFHQG